MQNEQYNYNLEMTLYAATVLFEQLTSQSLDSHTVQVPLFTNDGDKPKIWKLTLEIEDEQ